MSRPTSAGWDRRTRTTSLQYGPMVLDAIGDDVLTVGEVCDRVPLPAKVVRGTLLGLYRDGLVERITLTDGVLVAVVP